MALKTVGNKGEIVMGKVEPNKEYSLNELALIKGAFDKGNKYKYVGVGYCLYTKDETYGCSGRGIYNNYKTLSTDNYCSSGDGELFILVESTSLRVHWDGKSKLEAGMWVQTTTGQYEVLLPVDEDWMVVIKDNGAYIIQDFSGCKPVNLRTDKEKAMDAILLLYPEVSDFTKQVLGDAYDIWVDKSL